MKRIVLLLVVLINITPSFAHNAQLRGQVIDQRTNEPVESAIISLKPFDLTMLSNMNGIFSLQNIDAGNYTLRVEAKGYESYLTEIVLGEHESKFVHIKLSKKVIQLNELKIQSAQLSNPNILSKIDINSRPLNTAQDILRLVPGLLIAQHAGGGKAEQIFLRGFDCDHGTDINISVDGMPVNMVSHAHGQGYADLHFLIPETIDRVNVSKGPYKASIGNLATAGAVQFQTKNSIENNSLSAEVGMFGTYRLYGMLNLFSEEMEKKNQHLYVAGEYAYRKGFFDQPDHLHRMNLFAKYHGLLAKHHRITAQVSTFKSDWNASGQIPLRAVESGIISKFGSIDPTEGGSTGRMNASLQLESDLHHGSMLRNQLFYNTYDFNLYSNFTFYKNDSLHGDKIRQHENRQILGYNGAYFHNSQLGTIHFNTNLGIQARYDVVKDNELSNVTAKNDLLTRYSYGDVNELNIAAYLNEEVLLNKKWRMNLGLREDFFLFDYKNRVTANEQMNAIRKTVFSPKLNFYFQPHKNVQWFLLSGVGFHSNDTRVVVAQQGHQVLPKSLGAEIGLTTKPMANLLLTASLWSLSMQQEFVYVGDEAVVEPSGRTQRYGLDLSMRYDINRFIYADMDLNYARPRALEVSNEENHIPLAPTFTSIGGVNANIAKGLVASFRYRYLANRPGNESNTLIAKGYFINDILINYSRKQFIIGLSVENLFNVNWREAQFETESRLRGETSAVSEMHFTSGTPFFLKAKLGIRF